MKKLLIVWTLMMSALFVVGPTHAADSGRWSKSRADSWYAQQRWLVGGNYVPANAINQLEMWQDETFDPERIDLELGWAQKMGMNTMRVFLHDLLWKQDPEGFKKRIRTFLDIAQKHGIKPMFVLFDSCWDPNPELGPQHPPIPGVHNSGWVQGPGTAMSDPSQYKRFEEYVKDIVGTFAHDKRILAWDVWNEPDNAGGGDYGPQEPEGKFDLVAKLLPQVFDWARSQNPDQPLTSGLWHDPDWSDPAALNKVERVQIEKSDIITFHSYDWPEGFAERVRQLSGYDRPLICTEYMARGNGSTIDGVLPLAKKLDVGMINWGFVKGRSQTYLPWDSWKRPYTSEPPTIWFHDLLHRDGKPYRQREVDIIHELAASPRKKVPADTLMVPYEAGVDQK